MDAQAPVAAPVDQAGGQEVGGKGHGHQLGDAQPAAPGEAANGRQPADGSSHNPAQNSLPTHQKQGAPHLAGPIEAQGKWRMAAADQRINQQGEQGQQR